MISIWSRSVILRRRRQPGWSTLCAVAAGTSTRCRRKVVWFVRGCWQGHWSPNSSTLSGDSEPNRTELAYRPAALYGRLANIQVSTRLSTLVFATDTGIHNAPEYMILQVFTRVSRFLHTFLADFFYRLLRYLQVLYDIWIFRGFFYSDLQVFCGFWQFHPFCLTFLGCDTDTTRRTETNSCLPRKLFDQ